MMNDLSELIIEKIVSLQDCWFLFMTFIGATITQLLSFNLKTEGATRFLRMWFKDKSETWYARTNCVILVLIGTMLSLVILEPDSTKTSLFAGLTWCGTLQSLGQTINIGNND